MLRAVAADDRSRSGRKGGGSASHRYRAERAGTQLAPRLLYEPVAGSPWRADALGGLAGGRRLEEMSYVAVDELIDTTATLRVTPWPVIDERGRLRFPNRAAGFTVSADTEALRRQADAQREVSRPVRVGDAFLLVAEIEEARRGKAQGLAAWKLVDVSAPARDAAKAQHFASVAPVLDEEEIALLYRDLVPDDEPPPPAR